MVRSDDKCRNSRNSTSEASIRRHLQPLGLEWVHLQTGRTKERRRGVRSAARLYSSRKAHCSGMSGRFCRCTSIPSHPITNDQGQTPNMAQPVNVLCSADFQDLTENPMGMAQQWGTTGSSTGWSFGASNRIKQYRYRTIHFLG